MKHWASAIRSASVFDADARAVRRAMLERIAAIRDADKRNVKVECKEACR